MHDPARLVARRVDHDITGYRKPVLRGRVGNGFHGDRVIRERRKPGSTIVRRHIVPHVLAFTPEESRAEFLFQLAVHPYRSGPPPGGGRLLTTDAMHEQPERVRVGGASYLLRGIGTAVTAMSRLTSVDVEQRSK
jgi:hypothetical protein